MVSSAPLKPAVFLDRDGVLNLDVGYPHLEEHLTLLPGATEAVKQLNRRGFFTVMGATVEAACAGLADAGADLVGSNCGNGSARMMEIAAEFKRHGRLPVVIQSNTGLPVLRQGAAVYPETPADLAQAARGLKALGVAVIGGCCGTTPEHTRAMRRALDEEA